MTGFDGDALALALAPADRRPPLAAALRERAEEHGAWPASIAAVYAGLAQGRLAPMTVPAMNVRGLTYRVARAAWRTALRCDAGPLIFELAPSEAAAGDQSFGEYAAMVLAAAAREGYRGPVFLQGDHIDVADDGDEALERARQRCHEALSAGFRQVDIDAAGLAVAAPEPAARQEANAAATAGLAAFVQAIEPTAVVGGEVGEIGGANTTVADLRSFLTAVRERVPVGMPGLGKVSVQSGTRHGGVVRSDGSVGAMPVDVDLLAELARVAREEYGLPGVVQHGASTLTMAQLERLPAAGVIEVHLATGIQNLVLDHPALPTELVDRMRQAFVGRVRYAEGGHHDEGDLTAAQAFVQNRWRAWGAFKSALWSLPEEVLQALDASLEVWFEQLFVALGVAGRAADLALVEARG